MIKAIIFDCFSVLIGDATKARVNELWYVNPSKAEQFRSVARAADKGTISEIEAVETQADLLGITIEELREFRNKGEVRNAPLLEYIKASLTGKYRLAVVSNISSRARLESRFLPSELDELFNEVIPSGETGFIKPQPQIYHIALQRLGVLPEECVMIDDIPEFCEGARAVGMHAIQFSTNAQAIGELEALIDRGRQGV